MELYFDGWYALREDAESCLAQCEKQRAVGIGIVESKHGTFGLLYFCNRELFSNHKLDKDNAIYAPLRPQRSEKGA